MTKKQLNACIGNIRKSYRERMHDLMANKTESVAIARSHYRKAVSKHLQRVSTMTYQVKLLKRESLTY
jgi:hypothetical protein